MADELKDPKGMSADDLIDAVIGIKVDYAEDGPVEKVNHDAAVVVELRRRLEAYETTKAAFEETVVKSIAGLVAVAWHHRYGQTMPDEKVVRMAGTLHAFLASGK